MGCEGDAVDESGVDEETSLADGKAGELVYGELGDEVDEDDVVDELVKGSNGFQEDLVLETGVEIGLTCGACAEADGPLDRRSTIEEEIDNGL